MTEFWENPTHRMRDGGLVTRARARFKWARLTPRGRVHYVESVIVRWNFLGGTRQKPYLTFVMACGPQRTWVCPVDSPDPMTVCVRCESVRIRKEERR